MCIKEAMRCHVPVPFIQRELTQDTEIDGHIAPAGTIVNIVIYNLHHNVHVWEDSLVSVDDCAIIELLLFLVSVDDCAIIVLLLFLVSVDDCSIIVLLLFLVSVDACSIIVQLLLMAVPLLYCCCSL